MKNFIKKHPVWMIIIIIVAVLLIYVIFNACLPNYIFYHEEDIIEIKDIEYEKRLAWQVIDKDKLVGRVTQDNYDFRNRLGLLFLPDLLYTVKGDEDNISYYLVPYRFSEFSWGEHLYRTDVELPTLETIKPYRIELAEWAMYDYNPDNKVYYYTENEDVINQILRVLRDDEAKQYDYDENEMQKVIDLNSEYYCIYMFCEDVPGSVYEVILSKFDADGKVYIDLDDNVQTTELKEITYAIYKMVSEGIKVEIR